MKETISALIDGELDEPLVNKAIASIADDKDLDAAWEQYHLIGDAMRANRLASLDVRAKVAERLAAEPTVLAPRRWMRPQRAKTAGAVALAASVSFAAVVGWQQLSHRQAAPSVIADRGVPVQMAQPAQFEQDDPYVLAHQEVTADQGVMRVSYGNGVRH
ncbi:sigma-E factor negative regulatory protein [Chromobacterium amazonense]|uniref:Anti-sigma 24 factor n=1 Tax=Chromobacterium amazonense TaxID=1382803 RepID=A0A1S1WX16_9NEIS|nr:sigma-E factor negative regulatory protein [Chromobacterium amazonense]KIA80464.1 anti sigma-E protein RseA [Chromobacterium piscinae]MBM2883644.1 sigma-E factor negative regulatory protein [Chromobacterium amazonense]MDE1712137.1 sigma-E factor negative regulatory protein [Chromobacterium amazonense]OHX11841.1 anti-sigma 24 factor [Chromobacterium amazonense]PRP70816.1 anti-sigma 24 factor [Chromobacterium amazonense]